jgi:outer membrane biosynthesis protein TonB
MSLSAGSAKIATWLLPLLLLTGCFHKTQIAQNQPLAPPIEDTPPPKPEPSPTNLPPPEVTIPVQPEPQVPVPAEPVKKPPKHRRPPNTNPQIASNEAPVPAIGTLSTGDSQRVRQQTDDSIASTEKTLNGITRKLNDQETKIAAQIRELLKEAREALTAGDAGGARNLANKAKALLDELHP